MLTDDPFEFVGSDSQDDAPVFVKKTPPSRGIKKTCPSVRTPHLNTKKSPRIVISKNSDEINEMLDIKKAIEESKKTALQEERARRYTNRVQQKTTSSASGVENDNGTSSLSKHHRQSAVPTESEGSKAVTKKKQKRLQKKASPGGSKSNNSGPSPNGNQKNSSVKQIPIPVDTVSSSSRESSVTPTLTDTPTKKDSPVSRDADSSSTPTQSSTKKYSPVSADVDSLSSGNHLKSPTPTQTPTKKDSPVCSNVGASLSSGNGSKLSTLIQTPTKKDSIVSSSASSSLSSGNRLKLKRKRLPNISKEPSIKLSRVDTEFVASMKKPKPNQQNIANEKCEVAYDNNVNANTITNSGYKSAEIVTSVLMASQNEKDGGTKKAKQLKTEGRETIVKTTKGKGKKSSQDTSKCHLKKCPSLYAPRGTSACDYLPVIVRFFEDFKLQLQMAQNQCATFVPWSRPVTSSKKDWKADKDDGKSTINKSSITALPLTLTVPVNSAVKEQQKEMKTKKETVEVDSLWQWDYHGFDSDDQRLFYDSDPITSLTTNTLDQTPPRPTTTVTPSKHVENLSPLHKDISIDISSSNSNVSSVIHPGRRKRKLLGRRIMGSSDATLTGDKQSINSKQSFTSSLPRAPVYHTALLSSSPNITDIDEDPEQPESYNKKSVIDLTELEETAEVDSCGSPKLSQEKQVTCPVCQQQFGEAYIALHAANCELHVDSNMNTGRLLPTTSSSSSKLRQTTLTHKPVSTNTQLRKVIESDSDGDELIPPVKKRKTRKLLSDNSKKISLVYSKESDTIDHSDFHVQEKQSYLIGTSRSTAAATNSVFKSANLAEQVMEEIESYSSDNEVADPTSTTGSSLIDYKNQFSTNSVGKVSKELLTEDNDAFLLARKKKWLSAKKGRMGGKERQRRWKKFKAKGRGKK